MANWSIERGYVKTAMAGDRNIAVIVYGGILDGPNVELMRRILEGKRQCLLKSMDLRRRAILGIGVTMNKTTDQAVGPLADLL